MTMCKALLHPLFLTLATLTSTRGFAPAYSTRPFATISSHSSLSLPLKSSPEPSNEADAAEELTAEEEANIGNLVANEEWAGLSLELAEAVRTAVVEDVKAKSRDFLNNDDYAVGDFSKEIDRRVKQEVAKIREKDEYELGDFSVVLDDKVKEMVCEMTGNDEYEFGDLSTEIDKRVKDSVADYCGKDSYQVGDLSEALAKRTKVGVLKYTGKDDYQFGDITKQAFKNFTGKEDYQFGDVTKKLVGEDYQFGDVTKKLMGNFFGDKKK